jgi:hypothetical protein
MISTPNGRICKHSESGELVSDEVLLENPRGSGNRWVTVVTHDTYRKEATFVVVDNGRYVFWSSPIEILI